MNIVAYRDLGVKAWDSLADITPEAWLRHTSTYMDFALTLGIDSENHSFAIMDGDTLVALVPLIAHTGADGREFTMGGTPTPFPATAEGLSSKDATLAAAGAEIDRIATSHGILSARYFVDPLTEYISDSLNPLSAFGCEPIPMATSCVDLTQSEEIILKRIAKGHRSDLHFSERLEYRVDVFDHATLTDGHWGQFKGMYFAAAGREVGTPERWQQTFEILKKECGALIMGRLHESDRYVTGNVVFMYKRGAYYALSATLPGNSSRGMGALLQWKTMQYLKAAGYTRYELGWIAEDTASEKEHAISDFKSRFGGDVLAVPCGHKTYGVWRTD